MVIKEIGAGRRTPGVGPLFGLTPLVVGASKRIISTGDFYEKLSSNFRLAARRARGVLLTGLGARSSSNQS